MRKAKVCIAMILTLVMFFSMITIHAYQMDEAQFLKIGEHKGTITASEYEAWKKIHPWYDSNEGIKNWEFAERPAGGIQPWYFEDRFGRKLQGSEEVWAIDGERKTTKYVAYGGFLGRPATKAERDIIDRGEGYTLIGVKKEDVDKYNKEYAPFKEKVDNTLRAYTQLHIKFMEEVFENSQGKSVTLRDEILNRHGVDLMDVPLAILEEIYKHSSFNYGGFNPAASTASVERFLKLGAFREQDEKDVVVDVEYRKATGGRIEVLTKYKDMKGNVVKTEVKYITEAEYKALKGEQNATPQNDTIKEVVDYTYISNYPVRITRYQYSNGKEAKQRKIEYLSVQEAQRNGLKHPDQDKTSSGAPRPVETKQQATPTVQPKTEGIKVLINNQPLAMDVAPRVENGRTLVPLRAIFEALGAEINWEGSTQTVTATKGDTTVILKVGSTTAKVNDKTITLSAPAKSYNGRTLVPTRFVAEALGAKVDWHQDTQTVTVQY